MTTPHESRLEVGENAPEVEHGAEEQKIFEPERIRGLAHPFRLRLLEYLSDVPQATATECSVALGESVPSCAFHLRVLAKYGYIEAAPRMGREKPWKVVSHKQSHEIDPSVPGSVHALSELSALRVASESGRIQEWLRRAPAQPIEDIECTTVHTNSFYATHEEMQELREQILALASRFDGRWTDPALRPAQSKPTRLFAVLNFDPELPADE